MCQSDNKYLNIQINVNCKSVLTQFLIRIIIKIFTNISGEITIKQIKTRSNI